jgi:hypothetical protein
MTILHYLIKVMKLNLLIQMNPIYLDFLIGIQV